MTSARYCAVLNGSPLTPEEIAAGWHFCPDWDGLLVGPGDAAIEGCVCEKEPAIA